MVKKLVFDAQEAEGEAESIELVLNGEKLYIYRPTSGQTALMMAAFSSDANVTDSASAILNFYRNITDPEGFTVIKGILENPNIPDSLEQVMDLTELVIAEFTGNPTKQPTDYLPSRQSGGRSSTASRRQPGSTPSRSRRAGSATGSTGTSPRG